MKIPFGSIDTRTDLTPGRYSLEIGEMEIRETEATDAQPVERKLVVMPMYVVSADGQGISHWERFYVGTAEDPEGTDPENLTKNRDVKRLTQILQAAKVPSVVQGLEAEIEEITTEAKGCRFDAIVTETISKKNQRTYTNLSRVYEFGALKLDAGGIQGRPQPAPTRAPQPAQQAAPVRSRQPIQASAVEEYDEPEDVQQVTQRGNGPVTRQAPGGVPAQAAPKRPPQRTA